MRWGRCLAIVLKDRGSRQSWGVGGHTELEHFWSISQNVNSKSLKYGPKMFETLSQLSWVFIKDKYHNFKPTFNFSKFGTEVSPPLAPEPTVWGGRWFLVATYFGGLNWGFPGKKSNLKVKYHRPREICGTKRYKSVRSAPPWRVHRSRAALHLPRWWPSFTQK